MLKIYGTSMSRAGRALWAAEELGLKFSNTSQPEWPTAGPASLII